MTPQQAVEKVKNGDYALYLDNGDIKTLNIVLINAFKHKHPQDNYGPDKWFYGNQVASSWRSSPQNLFVDPDKVIKVSEISVNTTPLAEPSFNLQLQQLRSKAVEVIRPHIPKEAMSILLASDLAILCVLADTFRAKELRANIGA